MTEEPQPNPILTREVGDGITEVEEGEIWQHFGRAQAGPGKRSI